jgi:F420-0:gamma-glutamyl ligase
VMGKTDRIPVAIVRGLAVPGDGRGKDMIMRPEHDLFR